MPHCLFAIRILAARMRTQSLKILLALSVLVILVSGCNVAYRVLLGIDNTPEWLTDKELAKSAKKHNMPEAFTLVMDTATFSRALKEVYIEAAEELKQNNGDSIALSNLKIALKDDQQPTQFRLFDASGKEVFKLVNCYIDPPIPLNWNVEGCFDAFPPQTNIASLNIHHLDLQFLLAHSNVLHAGKLGFNELPKADYYGVIVWNDFYKRPSKRLIKTIRKYTATTDKTMVLLYINNQNQIIWPRLTAAQKAEVAKFYTE
jgi:hypothetical protein